MTFYTDLFAEHGIADSPEGWNKLAELDLN